MRVKLIRTRVVLIALLLVTFQVALSAEENQKFQFSFNADYYSLDNLMLKPQHISRWGEEIASYYAVLDQNYIYEEEPVAGDPNVVKRIRKPLLYKSINRVEAFLRKEVKRGNISEDEATDKLKNILKIGIAAISEDSKGFEATLKSSKKGAEVLTLFSRVVLSDM